MNTFLRLLIPAGNAILLAVLLSTWWAASSNTLFRNNKWLAGKDTCKFLFQTYDFLSKPLSDAGLLLTGNMGFQEILYRLPDSAERRMISLSCQVLIDPESYVWIELEKKGLQMIGIRISRNPSFKNGFYVYDDQGNLQQFSPYGNAEAFNQDWHSVQVNGDGRQWQLFIDGRSMGGIARSGIPDGVFGFRGSAPGRKVYVKDIAMGFMDPRQPAKVWEEKEDFSSKSMQLRALPWFLAFALLILGLRILRQEILSDLLPALSRDRYRLLDHTGLLFLLVTAWLLLPAGSSLVLPLSILGAEAVSLVCFAGLYKAPVPARRGQGLYKPIAFLLCLLAFTGLAFFKHGAWLWESQTISNKNLLHVHPGIIAMVPEQKESSRAFESPGQFTVSLGRPYFVPRAYSAQLIRANFTIPEKTTLDIVFQQQGFRTLGDLEGEELPLQRGLLRLSTRQDVASGLATNTGTRPAPFLKINGELQANAANTVEIHAAGGQMTISLNGEKTFFDHQSPLGIGETGLMVFENEVTVHNLEVAPSGPFTFSGNIFPLTTVILLLLFAIIALSLLRFGVHAELWKAAGLLAAALYPLLIYFSGVIFLPTSELIFLGKTRFAWLAILSAATVLSLFYLLIVYKDKTRWAPLYSNTILLGTLLCMLAFVWTYILPENHPLRIKFSNEIIAPGSPELKNTTTKGPWYNDSKFIGANTWVWKQQFGGEQAVPEKTAGKIRLFVLGGSQAWGSGAESTQETFSEQLEKRLAEKNRPVEVFNAGINGAGILIVAKTFKELTARFNPDIVIIDIGTNDSAGLKMLAGKFNANSLRNSLLKTFKEFVQFCRSNNIDVILNLETSCTEIGLTHDVVLYAGFEKIANEYGVPVVNASPIFAEKETDHMVYWDIAHFTPYGHRLMADILSVPLKEVVSQRISP